MKELNKQETIEELEKVASHLRYIRDYQRAIPCTDGNKYCMCNDFDLIVDSIDNLRTVFEKSYIK